MNAMTIADLPQSQELDREALAAISGGKLLEAAVKGKVFKKVEISAGDTYADTVVKTFMQTVGFITV
jgi:hypothetical protein